VTLAMGLLVAYTDPVKAAATGHACATAAHPGVGGCAGGDESAQSPLCTSVLIYEKRVEECIY
jgi:hypothetical protein